MPSTQAAILSLPNHLVVTHILRSQYFDDPADLARLPAVSRAMRDAVVETGLRIEELGEVRAAMLGCLNAVQRLQRGGNLSRKEYLCVAAARSGQLEELKALRADGCPWDGKAMFIAAKFGHEAMMRALIKTGADINKAMNDGVTLVYTAALSGQEMVLRALIKAADKSVTPLCVAALYGHEAEVRALIEAGADVNKARDDGWTPLSFAVKKSHAVIVHILRDAGAVGNYVS